MLDRVIPKAGLFAGSAEKLYRRAVLAYTSQSLDEAAFLLGKVLAADPGVVSARLLRGFALCKLERNADAIDDLQAVVTSEQPMPDRLMVKYLQRLVLEAAVNLTPRLTVTVPQDQVGAAILLAEAYQEVGRDDEAIDLLEGLGELNLDEDVVGTSLAELYAARMEWSEVIRVTDGMENGDDVTLAGLTFRAIALRSLSLNDAALDVLRACLKSKSRDDVLLNAARYERALVYEAKGRMAQARKDFELIYAEDPAFGDVASRLGLGTVLTSADRGQPLPSSQSSPAAMSEGRSVSGSDRTDDRGEAEEPSALVVSMAQTRAESGSREVSVANEGGSQQSEFATEAWYQSTLAVIGALLLAPPLGLYLMWDDLHGSAVVRWIVTALGLLIFVGALTTDLGYAIYLIGTALAAAFWAKRRGPREERIETHQKVVKQRKLGLQQPSAAPRQRSGLRQFLSRMERGRQ